MQKKQRIKYEIAYATRKNAAGAGRNTAMAKVENRYNISSDGVGGTRALGMMYPGADYWV